MIFDRKRYKREWYRRKRLSTHGAVNERSLDRSVEARFEFYCMYVGDCIVWTGSCQRGGYGQFNTGKTMVLAHRYNYVRQYGPIPEGLQVDHLCRNRHCVNPGHLEAVTPLINTKRGMVAQLNRDRLSSATHCKHGHAFDEINTYVKPDGHRACKACRRSRKKAFRARQRG
jgi:hypothetical protein